VAGQKDSEKSLRPAIRPKAQWRRAQALLKEGAGTRGDAQVHGVSSIDSMILPQVHLAIPGWRPPLKECRLPTRVGDYYPTFFELSA
jgi:hypothetical protein